MLKKISCIPFYGMQLMISLIFNLLIVDYIWVKVNPNESTIKTSEIFTIKGTGENFRRYPLIYRSSNGSIYWRVRLINDLTLSTIGRKEIKVIY